MWIRYLIALSFSFILIGPFGDVHAQELPARTMREQSSVSSLEFSPDGKTLASGGDYSIQFWDFETGKLKQTISGTNDHNVIIAFSADGQTLASGANYKIRFWDPTTGDLKAETQELATVTSIAFAPDGTTLAAGCTRGRPTPSIWNPATGNLKAEIGDFDRGHRGAYHVAFSPDGETLVSDSHDKNKGESVINVWNRSGKRIATIGGNSGYISAVSFSPDSKTVALIIDDQFVTLVDVQTGKHKTKLEGHAGYLTCVAFAPDGNTVATGSQDKTVMLWDVKTGKPTRTLQHDLGVSCIAFSPDGTKLAVGIYEGTICLWNTQVDSKSTPDN